MKNLDLNKRFKKGSKIAMRYKFANEPRIEYHARITKFPQKNLAYYKVYERKVNGKIEKVSNSQEHAAWDFNFSRKYRKNNPMGTGRYFKL